MARAVFRLKPSFGRIARTNSFMIFTQVAREKDVTAREYCIFGNQMFPYKRKAFLDKIV